MQVTTTTPKSQSAAPRSLKASAAPEATPTPRLSEDRMAFASTSPKPPSKIEKQANPPQAGDWVHTAFSISNLAAMGGFGLTVVGLAGGAPALGAVGALACTAGLVGFAGFGIALLVMKGLGK